MRHHYVPEFLLKAWADEAPDRRVTVFQLDLPGLPTSRHAPKYTAFEEDLYALSRPKIAGMEKHAVETRFLRQVDNWAARVRQRLERDGLKVLSRTDRLHWACFLMSLRLRQPNLIEFIKSEAANHLRQKLAEDPKEYEVIASDADPPSLEAWVSAQRRHYV